MHRDIALANGAEKAAGYRLLTAVIRTGCKAAILISKKI
jgi:ubiquinone biosynthesis monooxygenase Coq7